MQSIKRSRKFGTVGALVVMCTFGMLIWVKLRVVESVPRQAYAEPKHAVQGERTPAGFKQGMAPASAQLQNKEAPAAAHATAENPQKPAAGTEPGD